MIASRAILHDERLYQDPFEFRPERFLKDGKIDPDVVDPQRAAFGHGRRIWYVHLFVHLSYILSRLPEVLEYS